MLILRAFLFLSVVVSSVTMVECLVRGFTINTTCKPPRGVTCVEIRTCPLFARLLDDAPIPRPKTVIRFIRERQCGFEGNVPKVCCDRRRRHQQQQQQSDADGGDATYDDDDDKGGGGGNVATTPAAIRALRRHANAHLLPADCGRITNDFRITGGTRAGLMEFPWMALIAYDTEEGLDFRCGGTVINSRYVLTAAHCLQNLKFIGVRLGEYDINTERDCDVTRQLCAPPVQDFYVEDVLVHPQYNGTNFDNDIALMRLATPANFTSVNVQPICLPLAVADDERQRDGAELTSGKYGIISGWGVTDNGFKSAVLRKTTVNIVSSADCRTLYASHRVRISERQVCAGGRFGRDSCAGDSGGPLKYVTMPPAPKATAAARRRTSPLPLDAATAPRSPHYVQYGIVSYGPRHCGIDGQPGVYTKVAPYLEWILDNLRPDAD